MTMVQLGLGTFAEVSVNVCFIFLARWLALAVREAGTCDLFAGNTDAPSTFQILLLIKER